MMRSPDLSHIVIRSYITLRHHGESWRSSYRKPLASLLWRGRWKQIGLQQQMSPWKLLERPLFTSAIVTVSCWMWPWFIDAKGDFKAASHQSAGGELRGREEESRAGKVIHCIWPAKCWSQVNLLINNLELRWLNSTSRLSCRSLQRWWKRDKHFSCTKLAEVYSVTECGIQAIFPQNN